MTVESSTFALGAASQDVADRLRPRGNVSYVSGLTDDPLRFVTVSQALDEVVAAHGTRAAAIFSADRDVMSWKELQRQSENVANALLTLGIQRGHRVGILSANRREWLQVMFGTARIGAVLVSLDPSCRSNELELTLRESRCRALFVTRSRDSGDGGLGQLRALAPELDRPGDKPLLESPRFPQLRHVIVLGEGLVPARAERFSDLMRRAHPNMKRRLASLAAMLDPDDAVSLQFTSGTTGRPKPVGISHFGIVNNARHAARNLQITDVDKLCIAVPLHLGLGMVLGVMACVATGATMVFSGEGFDVARTLDAISRHRCTVLHGAPDMFAALVDHPELEDYDLSSLRTGIMAGAPCSQPLLERLAEQMCLDELTVAYGLTEVGPVVFQTSIDDPLELRAQTVGRVHPNIEAKIVDRNGHIVAVGRRGELCLRGYSVMRGYGDESPQSQDVFDETGWMHTGDLASLDSQGYCRIIGRLRDMLVRGNGHLSPVEIEGVIRQHPKVEDAQVFGIPDGRAGDEICAWVVLLPGAQATADEIRAFCRAKSSPDRVPQRVRFVADFPLTATGKVQKYLMRAATMQEIARSRETRTA